MANSRISSINQAQSEMYPWRRGQYMFAEPTNVVSNVKTSSKGLSVDAPEFVPPISSINTFSKGLSVQAPEFVPRWAREQTPAPPKWNDGNCYLISLDGYSDDDSEPELPKPTVSKTCASAVSAAAFQPEAATKKVTATLGGRDTDEPSTAPANRPWRSGAPWKSVATEQQAVESVAPSKLPPWKRDGRSASKPLPDSDDGSGSETTTVKSPASNTTTDVDTSIVQTDSDATLSEYGSPRSDGHDNKIVKKKVPIEEKENDGNMSGSEPEPEADSAVFKVSDLLTWRSSVEVKEDIAHEWPGKLIACVEPQADVSTSKAEASTSKASAPKTPLPKTKRSSLTAATGAASPTPSREISGSWRSEAADPGKAYERRERHSEAPLQVSENSWAAKMRARRGQQADSPDERTDEEVVRAMKSILNKLTIERFPQLYQQMTSCGIRTADHLEQLIREVFEKATTQHHFIDMYADLCSQLHEHFQKNPITDDPSMSFKKILLNACQASFEKNLSPPANLADMTPEEKTEAEFLYKMRMIGNIRLVGALLVRKMLASKVMLAIVEELLRDPTAEALETLAALLTVVGAEFDVPTFPHRVALNAIFCQLQKLVKQKSIPPRVRCLLKDVLDLRKSGWLDKKPKKIEKPTTLDEVHQKAATEDGSLVAAAGKAMARKIDSSTIEKAKVFKAAPNQAPREQIKAAPKEARKEENKTAACQEESKAARKEESKQETFDSNACHAEVVRALTELFVSYDVEDAVARVADAGASASQQATELTDILAITAEEGSVDKRKVGFTFVAKIFLGGHWKKAALVDGLSTFMGETCADLKFDVPALPKIVNQELYSALSPLVEAGILKCDQHKALATASF